MPATAMPLPNITRSGKDIDLLPDILTPAQVADMFCVDPKTVSRWCASGKIKAFRTPGNHRRFRKSDLIPFLKTR